MSSRQADQPEGRDEAHCGNGLHGCGPSLDNMQELDDNNIFIEFYNFCLPRSDREK
jgi:hypothetical protein